MAAIFLMMSWYEAQMLGQCYAAVLLCWVASRVNVGNGYHFQIYQQLKRWWIVNFNLFLLFLHLSKYSMCLNLNKP